MISRRLTAVILPLLVLILAPLSAVAQTQPAAPAAPSQAAAPAAPSSAQLLKPEELDALVAPIALYPDTLLSLVLMASTYPLEVIHADRWAKANKNLKGDQLKAATDKQAWDDSVKSLVAAPDVLSIMADKLDWTQQLGDAVLAQQPDVMDAVQRLRTRADANKKLTSTTQQRIVKEPRPASAQAPTSAQAQASTEYIYIEQTSPETLYVPYYDPAIVYGAWPYPAYPPYYWGYYPPYIGAGLIGAGLAFGAGWALGSWWGGGNYWGGGINWNNNNINVNRPRVNPLGGNNWQHRPEHRHGVRYGNSNVGQRFGNNRGGVQNRMDFRGRGGNQVLRPGAGQLPAGRPGAGGAGQRPGAGQLPASRPGAGGAGQRPGAGAGQRPGAGAGAGQRPSAGQRPAGGRPSAGQRPAGGRPSAGQRPAGPRGGGGNAFGNVNHGRMASAHGARGRSSMGGYGGGGGFRGAGGGGGFRGGGGGGGFRGGGGGGGRGGGGGGRRSDINLKHDIVLLGHLPNGLGYYRFSYNGSDRRYVGVMAQEVQTVMPDAVLRGDDGTLRVRYDRLGVKFQTYERWMASGARVPAAAGVSH